MENYSCILRKMFGRKKLTFSGNTATLDYALSSVTLQTILAVP